MYISALVVMGQGSGGLGVCGILVPHIGKREDLGFKDELFSADSWSFLLWRTLIISSRRRWCEQLGALSLSRMISLNTTGMLGNVFMSGAVSSRWN